MSKTLIELLSVQFKFFLQQFFVNNLVAVSYTHLIDYTVRAFEETEKEYLELYSFFTH